MTGSDHCKEAERLLRLAEGAPNHDAQTLSAMAQAHAILATASAVTMLAEVLAGGLEEVAASVEGISVTATVKLAIPGGDTATDA